jgi:hypothetical protein
MNALARYKELISCNRDIDRIQLELSEIRNNLRRLRSDLRARGVAVEAQMDSAIAELDNTSEIISKAIYPR